MKKLIAVFILMLGVSSISVAADKGKIEKDGNGIAAQGAAPNPTLSQVLTVVSTTLSKDILYWELYNPAAAGCKFRLMPTAAKGAYPQFTIPSGESKGYIKSKATFVNISGCTNGELLQQ
jgi:hypothetical protein